MKILKYLLFAIILLVLLFVAAGLMEPTVSYGHEIEVNKSVEEAWAVTQDESKYAEWLEGFQSIELLSGEKGEVGSTYKVVVVPAEGEDPFEMTQTVKALLEFDHVDLSFDSKFMDFEQTISFRAVGEGSSTVKTDSKVKGKGWMMRSMFAVMEMLTGSFTKQETKNLEALKKLINENTTDYYPAPAEMDTDPEYDK